VERLRQAERRELARRDGIRVGVVAADPDSVDEEKKNAAAGTSAVAFGIRDGSRLDGARSVQGR
jgi:hypothetical protein